MVNFELEDPTHDIAPEDAIRIPISGELWWSETRRIFIGRGVS